MNNIELKNIKILDELVYKTKNNKNYYICHWDVFDIMSNKFTILSKLANLIYTWIFIIEKLVNKKIWNDGYVPISEKIKIKFKNIFFPKKKLYKKLSDFCIKKKFDWIITWHYHMAKQMKNWKIEYIDGWDRISSCSMVVEDMKGKIKLIYIK